MNKKIILGISVLLLMVLVGGALMLSKDNRSTGIISSVDAEAFVDKPNHNWGEIGINDGNVEKTFEIKNTGTSPLELFDAYTSCGCTTAQLSLGSQKSPVYVMNSKYDYITKVPPGETAIINVVFDPLFHGPNGTGPMTREVVVKTNDPSNQEIVFFLTADVVK